MISSSTMRRRLEALATGLGIALPHDQQIPTVIDLISRGFTADDRASVWLTVAVIRARLPMQDDFDTFWRATAAEGTHSAIRNLVKKWMHTRHTGESVDVRVVSNAVVVDVHHTARTRLATGIQRVARQTVQRWANDRDLELVGWDDDFDAPRMLSANERQNALYGTHPRAERPAHRTVVIPTNSIYILPELAAEEYRPLRLACMARESSNATNVIGFDCVPLTSPETVGEGMGVAFSRNLTAVTHFDRVCAISETAAREYVGWRDMISGAGWPGPDIKPIILPSTAVDVTDEEIAHARTTLKTNDNPLVLCVGSHEPRKNHLALLYAAEVLWRENHAFNLVFIGGHAWKSDPFRKQLTRLVQHGRPVSSISAISDALLWSAYRLADLTVFPSLNEGFGLPVAESLAVGTPVIASGYGSMREIAEGGGVLLVNPRDDDDIVRALRELLTDAPKRERLAQEAAGRAERTWERYAAELWDYFVTDPAQTGNAAPNTELVQAVESAQVGDPALVGETAQVGESVPVRESASVAESGRVSESASAAELVQSRKLAEG